MAKSSPPLGPPYRSKTHQYKKYIYRIKFWRTLEKLPWLFLVVNENHQAVSVNKCIHTYCIYWYLFFKKMVLIPVIQGFFPLKFQNVQSEPKKLLRMRRSEKDSLSKLWHTNISSLFTISFFLCINLLFTNDYQNPERYHLFKLPKLKTKYLAIPLTNFTIIKMQSCAVGPDHNNKIEEENQEFYIKLKS